MLELQWRLSILFAEARHRPRERMRGQPVERVREPPDFDFPTGRKAFHLFHTQFARGKGTGFVERHDVDLRELLHRRTATNQDAVPRAPRDGRQHGARN